MQVNSIPLIPHFLLVQKHRFGRVSHPPTFLNSRAGGALYETVAIDDGFNCPAARQPAGNLNPTFGEAEGMKCPYCGSICNSSEMIMGIVYYWCSGCQDHIPMREMIACDRASRQNG